MNKRDFLEKVAEEYRQLGYTTATHPDKGQLPDSLADLAIDILARRGEEVVAIQCKARDQLYDLGDVRRLGQRVEAQPGWHFHLVVFPPNGALEIPAGGIDRGVPWIQSLLDEADRALQLGLNRAAQLIAWAAAEAAMREAARRGNLPIDREAPRFVLKTLFSNGIISREDHDRIQACFAVRNSLIHGLEPAAFDPADARYLLVFARMLVSGTPQAPDSELARQPVPG